MVASRSNKNGRELTFLLLAFVLFPGYGHFVHAYGAGRLPNIGDCAGSEGAALFGCALISSYLFLFIGFVFLLPAFASPRHVENKRTDVSSLWFRETDSTEPPTRPPPLRRRSEEERDPRSSERERTDPPSLPRSKEKTSSPLLLFFHFVPSVVFVFF